MPQELRVIQCFQCEIFQVDIVKKVNKWQCKVCNAKQSLRKEFFRGSGAECRNRVQELNKKRSECASQKSNAILNIWTEDDFNDTKFSESNSRMTVNAECKWDTFLDDPVKKTEIHYAAYDDPKHNSKDPEKEIHGSHKRPKSDKTYCLNDDDPKHTSKDPEKELHGSHKRSKWDKFL